VTDAPLSPCWISFAGNGLIRERELIECRRSPRTRVVEGQFVVVLSLLTAGGLPEGLRAKRREATTVHAEALPASQPPGARGTGSLRALSPSAVHCGRGLRLIGADQSWVRSA
jgi:hypothetical protein